MLRELYVYIGHGQGGLWCGVRLFELKIWVFLKLHGTLSVKHPNFAEGRPYIALFFTQVLALVIGRRRKHLYVILTSLLITHHRVLELQLPESLLLNESMRLLVNIRDYIRVKHPFLAYAHVALAALGRQETRGYMTLVITVVQLLMLLRHHDLTSVYIGGSTA